MSYTPGPPTDDEQQRLKPLGGWRWQLLRLQLRMVGLRDRLCHWARAAMWPHQRDD